MRSGMSRQGTDGLKPGAGLPRLRVALYCTPPDSSQAPSLPARHQIAAAAPELASRYPATDPAIHPAYDPISRANGSRCGFARQHYQLSEWSHKLTLWAWARWIQADGYQVTRHGTV